MAWGGQCRMGWVWDRVGVRDQMGVWRGRLGWLGWHGCDVRLEWVCWLGVV